MKRLLLAYNPVSGNALFKSRLDSMIEAFQKRDVLLSFYRTQKGTNEAMIEFARETKAEGIIAAGGDGTLHQVVNLVMKAGLQLPVGMIGSGTSNDFATYLHIHENLEEYFDRIAAGKTRKVDLGRTGDRYFVNVASAGALTSIAHEVNAKLKNALGKMAYYLRGIGEIPKFRSFPVSLKADGQEWELEAFLFIVLNSSVVGSMKNVAAEASVDDGKLDFLAVKKCSPARLMKLTADLIAGKSVAAQDAVFHVQAQKFLISAQNGPTVSDLDGELGPELPLEIETIPQAIEFYC